MTENNKDWWGSEHINRNKNLLLKNNKIMTTNFGEVKNKAESNTNDNNMERYDQNLSIFLAFLGSCLKMLIKLY